MKKGENLNMDKATFDALSKEDKICTLEGTAYFAHVQSPDMGTAKRFNATPNYVLQLGLDEAGVKAAEIIGLKIKPATDHVPLPHVQLKRKVKDETNPQASKPDLVDSMQKPIPDNILIGNGSTVACKFGTYWYEAGGNKGVGTSLFKTQVRNLIPFEGASDGTGVDSVDDSGWTVGVASDRDELFDDAVSA